MTLEQATEDTLVLKAVTPRQPTSVVQAEELAEPLNDRESQILKLIAQGLSNREIAEQLMIGVGTVKWHINNLFGKLGVHSRTLALARAKDLGLI